MYGLAPIAGLDGGGFLTDLVYARELAALDPADRRVLVLGGLSIGLYAAAVAVALGVRVDYVDTDQERLAIAERLGAKPIEWRADGSGLKPAYPVTASTSPTVEALHTGLRSTWPGGVCTDTGIFFSNLTPMPLLELYGTGIIFMTGRVMARAMLPEVIGLVEEGSLNPVPVTAQTVTWGDADTVWPAMTGKTVFVRR